MNQSGQWISRGTAQPFYVRKELFLHKPVHSAEALVSGLGQFVLHVNGQKAGDHELDPGWTDYRKEIQYVRFDLTDLLHEGTNAIGAEIGNGWYILDPAGGYIFHFPPFMPPNPNPYQAFGKELVFFFRLHVEYTDGSTEDFTADDSWKTMEHAVLHSNVYGSEIIDLSKVQEGFSETGFGDSSWEPALLSEGSVPAHVPMSEQTQPPVKVIHSYDAKYLHTVGNRRIYDFTQNMSGIPDFEVRGRKGAVICLYPAEKLKDDGDVDPMAKNWMVIDTKISITLGKEQEWQRYRQKFSYLAGRYLAVEIPEDAECEIRNLHMDAITSAWQEAGTFTCDDERYNRIYDLVEKAVEANMLSVHTDCPTIERFAWQEPNHLMAPAILFMKDGRTLWEKFLKDMRNSQHTAEDSFKDLEGKPFVPGDGLVPSQCPCYIPNVLPVPGMGSFYDIVPWGSSMILAAAWHYLFYGDVQVLKENYPAGVRYLNHLKTKMTEEGFLCHGLGDWGNPDQQYARENIETAFLYWDAVKLAESAEILGLEEEAQQHRLFAERICRNYNRQLLVQKEDGHWIYCSYERKPDLVMTQACEALPLYFGMVPEDKRIDVEEAFRQCLLEKGCFSSGEVGLPYIIQTAHRLGMDDVIAKLITREEHPSYYAFVKEGLTTLGEYWEQNPRSQCHDMMGHIIEWYYTGIAGIEILSPGFAKISVHPYMPEGMNCFTCTYPAKQGVIRVEGRRIAGKPEFTITVPEGIELVQERK